MVIVYSLTAIVSGAVTAIVFWPFGPVAALAAAVIVASLDVAVIAGVILSRRCEPDPVETALAVNDRVEQIATYFESMEFPFMADTIRSQFKEPVAA